MHTDTASSVAQSTKLDHVSGFVEYPSIFFE